MFDMPDIIKRPRPRIESLSDLIFGLALSVGTISLITRLPRTQVGMLYDITEFGFSFMILISVWLTYTNVMSVLPLEDSITVIMNLGLLFLVAIEPYLFYLSAVYDLVANEALLNVASILYALDLAGLMIILALFMHQLTLEERNLLPEDIIGKYKSFRTTLFISAILFAITILPTFWIIRIANTPLRFYVWTAPLVISSVKRISKSET